MKKLAAVMTGFILALAALSTSHADTYTHTALGSGYISEGINNTGTIVGSYGNHGFIFSGGSYSLYDFSGANSTNISHMNDVGEMVGFYKDTAGNNHGYYTSSSSTTTLNYYDNVGPAAETYVTGINNAGTIVGWWADTSGSTVGHGFILSGGGYTSFDYPGATKTYALGINDAGTIVGWYADANGEHGFTLSNGTPKSIDYPLAAKTHALGINNAGTIVGWYADVAGTQTGFTLNNGVFAPLSFAAYALSINDAGSILTCWPYLGDLCAVYTGYTVKEISVANIDNVSDTFTVWLDVKQGKDGTPAPNVCGGVLKIMDANGRAAVQQSCEFLDEGTGRHRFTLQIAKDNQPNTRARYIEKASFYGCTSISSSDPSDCSLVSGTPSDFSVYGTTFDIGKHAWKFANGSWMNTPGQPSKYYAGNANSWWVFHNNFYKAASVIQSYIKYTKVSDFWRDIGYGAYEVPTYSSLYKVDSHGLCYGLANAAIASYTHQNDSEAWGIEGFTQANWNADIQARWTDSTKTPGPFGVLAPDDNIFIAPSLNDSSTKWTIDSAKKTMYYFVTQSFFSSQTWPGKDSTQALTASSESNLIDILKNGAPVSLGGTIQVGTNVIGGHQIVVPQLLVWDGQRNIMIWDNRYPLEQLSNAFGPYPAIYFEKTNSYNPGLAPSYIFISKETGLQFQQENWSHLDFVTSGCGDSQNIYNQWTAPCIQSQASAVQADASDVSNYPYPNHIQVLIIGAQLNSVNDQTTNSSVTLVPGGDVIAGQAVQTVSGDGLFTTLYLPATDTYQIQATKYAGSTGLTVLVTIPNTDGTVQLLNYNNMSTGDADATQITFIVGRGNSNAGISRTIASDTYNPDYNGTLPTVLNPPSAFKAIVNNSGTAVALSWINTSNPLLASVKVIRKAGSAPTSITDGVTVYSGTGQSVSDNAVTANTLYYYSAYSLDNSSNTSDPVVIQIDTTLRSVYGTVSLSGGGVLAGANLQLFDVSNKLVSGTSTAADGTYAISNIANGSYTLTASSSTVAITNPSTPVTINGASQEEDFTATNQKTLFLLFDAPSVTVGDTVSILWAYRNISNSETVNITLLRNGVPETIALGVPILTGTVSWTVTTPNVASATLQIALASDPTVNAHYDIAIAPGYDFMGVPVSGAAPLAVSFIDLSLGSIGWLWNFGDGATSTVQNPLHLYANTGTYNVSLMINGTSGQNTITKNNYVSVSGTCTELPVTIADVNSYYSSIGSALSAALDGDIIQIQQTSLTESPTMSQGISLTLSGGYDCDYTMNPGFSVINGNLTVSSGSVTIGNIIIK